MNDIRVRFAPSPTGYLHIGSARTAFFNWLFAKKTGGTFILRIEDTDISRHREDLIKTILDSLKWLSITWEEGPDIGGDFGPYRQSERNHIYQKYANILLTQKKAYRCFCSTEELKRRRDEATDKQQFFVYDRKCLSLTEKEIEDNLRKAVPFSIRMLVPQEKTISFDDKVYGHIEVKSSTIDDFIIIRSNGMPTYNFSVVIDDYLMKITHVIRGEDHLSNTPKQLLVYEALDVKPPSFTHLPMILADTGEKLSKRHGAISIESYREEGFLPEAVKNYIALLGWAFDEKTTIFTENEMIERFSLETINKKAARFDYEKLLYINGIYIKNYETSKLANMVVERLKKSLGKMDENTFKENGILPENIKDAETAKRILNDVKMKITKIIPLVNKRARTLGEIEKMIYPFFFDISYPDEIKNFFSDKDIDAISILNQAKLSLNKIDTKDFCCSYIEKTLRGLAKENNLNFGKVAEILRIAIWGKTIGFPLFETMEILGKDKTLKRLSKYLEIIS